MAWKNLSKGVKVDVLDGVVCVDLALNLKYGYEIPATCEKRTGKKLKTAIENMTGLEVSDVNVAIAGVNMEQTKSKNNEPRGNKATPYNPAVLVNYSEPDEMEEK